MKRKFESIGSQTTARLCLPMPATFDPSTTVEQDVERFLSLNSPSAKMTARISSSACKIKQLLLEIPELCCPPTVRETEAVFQNRGIQVPIPARDAICQDLSNLVLKAPRCIELSSLFFAEDEGSGKTNINFMSDVFVEIPSTTFDKGDYLDFRYFHKRALYLGHIACSLLAGRLGNDYLLAFNFLDGDSLRPVLIVSHVNDPYLFRIVVTIPDHIFPSNNMGFIKCGTPGSYGGPTPQYNGSILADCYHLKAEAYRQRLQTIYSGFRECLLLGNIWIILQRRSGHILRGGFGFHEWSVIQGHVLNSAKSRPTLGHSTFLNALHLFNSVLRFISDSNLVNQRPTTETDLPLGNEQLNPTHNLPETFYNVLYKVSDWSYTSLRSEAFSSLHRADVPLKNYFAHTFSRYRLSCFRGTTCIVDLPAVALLRDIDYPALVVDWDPIFAAINRFYNVLKYGLGNRCIKLSFGVSPGPNWPIGKENAEIHTRIDQRKLSCYLTLDDENARRLLDYGPCIDDAIACSRFQKFWDGKSELRRFKDGVVREVVCWDSGSSPVEQIFKFVLEKIASGPPKTTPEFFGLKMDGILPGWYPTASPISPYEKAIAEFHSISSYLRSLRDLPLHIAEIREISPELRYTSVLPPSKNLESQDLPLHIHLMLESSKRWPDDDKQRRRSEVGILLRVAKILRGSEKFQSVKVGIHVPPKAIEIKCFLDLLTPSGYLFRAWHIHPELDAEGVDVVVSPSIINSRIPEAEHRQQLSELVSQLCRQHILLSPIIRLVKKWFQSHNLSLFFENELLEAFSLTALQSVGDAPRLHGIMEGFWQVIFAISVWDWRKYALKIEISRPFTCSEKTDILAREKQKISTGDFREVQLATVITSPGLGFYWKASTVPVAIAAKISQLSREACALLSHHSVNLESLFTTTVSNFDFVIYLKIRAPNMYHQSYKNLPEMNENRNAVDFWKIFCSELEAYFGNAILFFPSFENMKIECVWRPQTHLKPSDVYPQGIYNKAGILQSIRNIGRGVIDEIQQVPK